MNTREAINKFINRYTEYGFSQIVSEDITTSDPTLLFINSTMVHFKDKMQKREYIEKTAVVQNCFRNNGDGRSLNLFTMIGVSAMGDEIDLATKCLLQFIYNDLQMEKSELHFIIHRDDGELEQLWLKYGVKENLHYTDEFDPIYSTRWKYGEGFDFTGRGATLVHESKDVERCSNDCDIFCGCKRFFQFGNIIIIENGETQYIDIGCGLERMLSFQSKNDLYGMDEIQNEIEKLPSYIEGSERRNVIYNLIRSIDILLDTGFQSGNQGASYIIKSYIRRFVNELDSFMEFDYKVEELSTILEDVLQRYLVKNADKKIGIIKEEAFKYCNRISKNIELSKKVILNSKLTQEEKILIMKDRFGLPEQLSLKLLIDKL